MTLHALRYHLGTLLVRVALWLMQPKPVRTDGPHIADLVIADAAALPSCRPQRRLLADLADRKALGRIRYGVALQDHNGRDAMLDAYQEVQDAPLYLRQAAEEARSPVRRRARLALQHRALRLALDVRREMDAA